MMLHNGDVDGAVGGCKYSTAEWMRPVFQIVGTAEGVSTVSAICFFVIKDKPIFFADTDFVIKPDAAELSQIALNSASFVRGLGIEPKVAFLSYSTKGSGEHESLDLIRNALALSVKADPNLVADGEIQHDAPVNPDAASKKCPDSVLAGDANVLIFPDITVGNVLTHALVQWTDYPFFGSFPVGLAKPVMNGGRSFDASKIFHLIVAAAAQVNMK
jgi:phosphate acetyltransferase